MFFGVHNHLTGRYFTEEKVLFTLRGYIGIAVSAPQCLPAAARLRVFTGVATISSRYKVKEKAACLLLPMVGGGAIAK